MLLTLTREEDERYREHREIHSSAFQLALPLASCTAADLVMEVGLKNNKPKTEFAAYGALPSPESCEEHLSTENELTPERCPWLSEVTATRNTQLRALLHRATEL